MDRTQDDERGMWAGSMLDKSLQSRAYAMVTQILSTGSTDHYGNPLVSRSFHAPPCSDWGSFLRPEGAFNRA